MKGGGYFFSSSSFFAMPHSTISLYQYACIVKVSKYESLCGLYYSSCGLHDVLCALVIMQPSGGQGSMNHLELDRSGMDLLGPGNCGVVVCGS